jgi:hypothetical protein
MKHTTHQRLGRLQPARRVQRNHVRVASRGSERAKQPRHVRAETWISSRQRTSEAGSRGPSTAGRCRGRDGTCGARSATARTMTRSEATRSPPSSAAAPQGRQTSAVHPCLHVDTAAPPTRVRPARQQQPHDNGRAPRQFHRSAKRRQSRTSRCAWTAPLRSKQLSQGGRGSRANQPSPNAPRLRHTPCGAVDRGSNCGRAVARGINNLRLLARASALGRSARRGTPYGHSAVVERMPLTRQTKLPRQWSPERPPTVVRARMTRPTFLSLLAPSGQKSILDRFCSAGARRTTFR